MNMKAEINPSVSKSANAKEARRERHRIGSPSQPSEGTNFSHTLTLDF